MLLPKKITLINFAYESGVPSDLCARQPLLVEVDNEVGRITGTKKMFCLLNPKADPCMVIVEDPFFVDEYSLIDVEVYWDLYRKAKRDWKKIPDFIMTMHEMISELGFSSLV